MSRLLVSFAMFAAVALGLPAGSAAVVASGTLQSVTVTSPNQAQPMAKGSTRQYTATARYSDGSTTDVSGSAVWNSSNPTVATVDSAGVVTGHVPGQSNLTAAFGGKTSPAVKVVVDKCTIIGTAGDDTLDGTPGADYICGLGGNDTINGLAGADTLDGGAGDDTINGDEGADKVLGGTEVDTILGGPDVDQLYGGAGDDVIGGNAGNDQLFGEAGNDTLSGDEDADRLTGGAGDDTAHAGAGADLVYGDAGNDTLNGGDGLDRMWGGADNDALNGDGGDDQLYGEDGADMLDGGADSDRLSPGAGDDPLVDGGDGVDTVLYDTASSAVTVSLSAGDASGAGSGYDILSRIENATGSAHDDALLGDEGVNLLIGGAGNDTLNALGGADNVYAGAGGDVVYGGEGNDYVLAQEDNDEVYGEGGDDSLDGGTGDDFIDGGDGTDSLIGDAGVDRLYGGDGNDALNPGLGDDAVIDGGVGTDAINYSNTIGSVTIDIAAGTSTGGGGNDAFSGIEDAGGTQNDDFLFGDAGPNRLSGKLGNDTIDGRDGNDTIFGGAGDDGLRGGAGTDVIDGQAGTDTCDQAGCELSYNLPPVLDIAASTNTFTEGDSAKAVDSTLTLTDDSAALTGATIGITSGFESGRDFLSVSGLPAGVTASYVAPTLTISGSATPAQYQAILRSVRFENTSQNPSTTDRTIEFTVTDGEHTDGGNLVTMAVLRVNDAPIGDADSFGGGQQGLRMRVGTTHADTHEVEVAGNVLNGDADVDTPVEQLTTTPGTIATADGGSVIMASDGSFTYDPPAGDDGSDSFTYTVEDNDTGDSDGTEDTHSATVTITQVGPRVWFVNDDAPAGGRGVSHAPLQSLAPLSTGGAHDAKDGTGDRIFVHSGTYAAGIALENDQKLIGEPNGLNVGGTQFVPAGGTAPAISGSGDVVSVGTGNELQDLALSGGSTTLAGTAGGALLMRDTTIANTAGRALSLAGGHTVDAIIPSLTSANSGTQGVNLNAVNGTLSVTAGAISNATGAAFAVNGGNATVAYGGTVTDGTGTLVDVINTSGGSRTFSGAITDAVDGDNGATGVNLNNAAGTHSFTGGVQLSTGASHAFAASNSGTTLVSGATNTLKTTSGSALRVIDTSIHDSDLTFRRIDSNGGNAFAGIHLQNTSGTGGLTVTGDGATAGSGGTIANKQGGDSSAAGNGIHLDTTRDISLSRMQLNDHANYAIRGNVVNGFKLLNSVVNGTNGNNAAIDEAAVSFAQLTGTGVEVTGSTISGGVEDNLQVHNSSGTLNRLTVSNSTIGHNGTAEGNDGIGILLSGTAVAHATIQDSTFNGARGDMVDHNVSGTSNSDLILLRNTMHNTHPNIVGGGGGLTISASGSGDLTYDVDGNSIRGSKGSNIVVCKCFGGLPGDGTAAGTIENNVLGDAGVANSGSSEGSGIAVTELTRGRHSTTIRNNTIRRYSNHGILMTVGGASNTVTGLAHDGVANFTITGNTIGNPNAPAGGLVQNGIHLNSGTNSGDDYSVCLNLGSPDRNTLGGSGALGGTDYRLRQRFNTDVRMPGYTGVANDPAATGSLDSALVSYLTPRTNGAFTLSSGSTSTGGFFNTAGGAPCAQS